MFSQNYLGNCTGLKPEWTHTLTASTEFPVGPGTVMEVTCSDPGFIIAGSSQVTCAAGTQFTYRIEPYCLGKNLTINSSI